MINITAATAAIEKPIICTCVNGGYAKAGLVENWTRSLLRCGLGKHALIVALDDDAAHAVSRLPVHCLRWNTDQLELPSRMPIAYRTAGWKQIVFSKVMLVRALLSGTHDVLFSDADIVFLQNPLPFICSLPKTDFHFQSDAVASDPRLDARVLCSGFYFARPTEKAIEALQDESRMYANWKGDQDFLRFRLGDQKVASCTILDRQLFPNGDLWKKKPPARPMAVHFNWTIGAETKVAAMKASGLWLLAE
jgi:hypothetical protein